MQQFYDRVADYSRRQVGPNRLSTIDLFGIKRRSSVLRRLGDLLSEGSSRCVRRRSVRLHVSGCAPCPEPQCTRAQTQLRLHKKRIERWLKNVTLCHFRWRRLFCIRCSGDARRAVIEQSQKLFYNPVTRNRTRDHLISAYFYSQMLCQLSYDRSCRGFVM